MAIVSTHTANWRLFGGGGLLVGALVWTLHVVLTRSGILVLGPWPFVLALVVVSVAFVLIAVGETGSNGAVGSYLLGKVALIGYATGFLLLAVDAAASLGRAVTTVAAIFVIAGGLVSAYAVYRKAVAKGAARWFLFLPAVVGALWAIGVLGVAEIATIWWFGLLLAVLLLITGALYLFNSRKFG
jgi:hypothetical protein